MSDKQNYIFIFTITPVQSFIAQARKIRDLYAGSQILSELTKKAIKLAKDKNAEIIIPNVEDIDKAHSISNKFVAIFKSVDKENLESFGKNIEFNTILYWKNKIANKILENVEEIDIIPNNKCENSNYQKFYCKFNDHIMKYFNIYWLFYPIENNYKEAYKEAEKYLGALKNIRCFEQFETEENNRKCSICGERDAIVYKNIEFINKNKTKPAYAYKNSLQLPNNNSIQENEGLCGICFVKRFYKYKENEEFFPSTAKITLLNLYNDNEIENKINNEYKKFFNNCWNDQFLFKENLNRVYLKKQGCKNVDIKEAKEKLDEIYKLAKEKNLKISKYYALIKFDGDNMGKWLSGDEKFFENEINLKDFHKALSYNLSKFAEHSRKYIDGELDRIQRGKTVYAGGDDFLGFINLNCLFKVLENLRKDFDEKVNKPLREQFLLKKDLTFSAGIVIAHYKDPLSLVLDWTNKLEEEAKSLNGKNAFGIAVLKRSGEIRKAIYKWKKLEYIKAIYESIVIKKEFNSSFITKLEESFRKVPVEDPIFINKKGNKLFLYELKRVLNKSPNLDKKNKKEKINLLEERFKNLIKKSKFEELFGILNIIKFLERELL